MRSKFSRRTRDRQHPPKVCKVPRPRPDFWIEIAPAVDTWPQDFVETECLIHDGSSGADPPNWHLAFSSQPGQASGDTPVAGETPFPARIEAFPAPMTIAIHIRGVNAVTQQTAEGIGYLTIDP